MDWLSFGVKGQGHIAAMETSITQRRPPFKLSSANYDLLSSVAVWTVLEKLHVQIRLDFLVAEVSEKNVGIVIIQKLTLYSLQKLICVLNDRCTFLTRPLCRKAFVPVSSAFLQMLQQRRTTLYVLFNRVFCSHLISGIYIVWKVANCLCQGGYELIPVCWFDRLLVENCGRISAKFLGQETVSFWEDLNLNGSKCRILQDFKNLLTLQNKRFSLISQNWITVSLFTPCLCRNAPPGSRTLDLSITSCMTYKWCVVFRCMI